MTANTVKMMISPPPAATPMTIQSMSPDRIELLVPALSLLALLPILFPPRGPPPELMAGKGSGGGGLEDGIGIIIWLGEGRSSRRVLHEVPKFPK